MAMHPLESSVHQALFDALRSQVETHLNDRILDYADGLANRDDFTKALDAVAGKAYQQLEEELFGAPPPTPQFFDEYDFFLEFLAPAYGNTEAALTRVNWSDQWYNHEQVLLRIHELNYLRVRGEYVMNDGDGNVEVELPPRARRIP